MKSFGAGLLIFPHGIHVDKDGNVWVTDGQDDAPVPARGAGGAGRGAAGAEGGRAAAPTGPIGPRPGATHGNQVFKFSPDGKVLLTLGKPGGAASPDYFYQPNDVITAPNGDIFVSEGHGAGNNRVLKFDKNGKFIKEWGRAQAPASSISRTPWPSTQRPAVCRRSQQQLRAGVRSGRQVHPGVQAVQLSERIFIKNDILYVADSSRSRSPATNNGWKRGIRYGSINDGGDRRSFRSG